MLARLTVFERNVVRRGGGANGTFDHRWKQCLIIASPKATNTRLTFSTFWTGRAVDERNFRSGAIATILPTSLHHTFSRSHLR
jgi:hypothetical protein